MASTVVEDVKLVGEHLFDHSQLVHKQVELFVERFEKNDRHREFDGLLRASHTLVEAAEAPVEALFDNGKMTALIESTNKLTERIEKLTKPTYEQEHKDYLSQIVEGEKKRVEEFRQQTLSQFAPRR